MTDLVRIQIAGDVAVIAIDNPPVNAFAAPVRAALLAAVEKLDADAAVKAIVLHGVGRNFVAGADLREFDRVPVAPLLHEVLRRVESCSKPVVAALHGATLGGGAECALASHYRCASSDLQLGFPEVKVGLLPGAGGTVRLPRLIGVERALEMTVGGDPINANTARERRIIDRIVGDDVLAAAIAWANELVESKAPVRRLRDATIPDAATATPAWFAAYRESMPRAARKLPAPDRIVQCLEAAVNQSFDAALAKTRELFEQCRTSSESRSLRHLFFAERGSAVQGDARQVRNVGVIGSGTMGAGIAISLATGGYDVILVDANTSALETGLQRVRSTIDGSARKGRLSAEAAAAAVARVKGSSSFDDLAAVDLVIEAVFEKMSVKQEVFGKLGAICRPGTVLATNTSTLDVDAIAAACGRPQDVVGMHFFSPANIMKLVEIVRGRESSAASLATAAAVTKKIGKLGVVVGNCFGFVGNRMLYAYGREKELMMLEGATPEQVDRALQEFGMAMGPNAVGDLAGLDIGASVRKEWVGKPDDPRFYRVSDLLAERGRLGQKSGAGFYRYEGAEKKRTNDPEVTALIQAEAARLGVPQRTIEDREIVERCMYALINEGARILDEGIARSAADIDVIWCNGYGYPRTRGGPMFHADTVGLPRVLEGIRRYGREQGPRYWSPAQRIVDLARDDRRFSE